MKARTLRPRVTTVDDAFEYATEPHCDRCGTAMRFADGAYRYGGCGAVLHVPAVARSPAADELPGILGA